MKISIITVCYNSAATIEQTIQSVLSQTYTSFEYILIDGKSTDDTMSIIEKYKDQIAVIVSEKDSGIYDAMNKGIELATGDIIGILNSDDLYYDENVLQKVAIAFEKNIDCLCTDVEIFSGSPQNILRYYSCTRWKKWMFHIGHQPPHPGFFVRKSGYSRYGKYIPQLSLAADFELMCRLLLKHKLNTSFQPWVSVSMRSGGESQRSFANIRKANNQVYEALKLNGYFSLPIFIWLKYPFKIFQFLFK